MMILNLLTRAVKRVARTDTSLSSRSNVFFDDYCVVLWRQGNTRGLLRSKMRASEQ